MEIDTFLNLIMFAFSGIIFSLLIPLFDYLGVTLYKYFYDHPVTINFHIKHRGKLFKWKKRKILVLAVCIVSWILVVGVSVKIAMDYISTGG